MRSETNTLGVRSETNTFGVKKFLTFVLVGLFLGTTSLSFAYAADGTVTTDATSGDNSLSSGTEGGGGTTVTVTEEIPGMDCTQENGGGPEKKKYKCTIQSGFGSVMAILSGLIKYATFITALVGVLMLVVSGIMYSMSGANSKAKTDATEHLQKVILGLVLLFLVGFILNTVAPWVYR